MQTDVPRSTQPSIQEVKYKAGEPILDVRQNGSFIWSMSYEWIICNLKESLRKYLDIEKIGLAM